MFHQRLALDVGGLLDLSILGILSLHPSLDLVGADCQSSLGFVALTPADLIMVGRVDGSLPDLALFTPCHGFYFVEV